MALHGHAALRKPHIQPRLHPARPAHHDVLVGCKGMQIGIKGEQRKAFAHHARMINEIAVHEDYNVVFAKACARHRPQDKCDCDALAGLVLAYDAQRDIAIGANQLEVVADFNLVAQFA